MSITLDDLKMLEEVCEKTSSGTWERMPYRHMSDGSQESEIIAVRPPMKDEVVGKVSSYLPDDNPHFIVMAHKYMPLLVAELRKHRAAGTALVEAWAADNVGEIVKGIYAMREALGIPPVEEKYTTYSDVIAMEVGSTTPATEGVVEAVENRMQDGLQSLQPALDKEEPVQDSDEVRP